MFLVLAATLGVRIMGQDVNILTGRLSIPRVAALHTFGLLEIDGQPQGY